VLSGGVWNAPELAAAYNDGIRLPDLYAGAPEWVAGQVLNHRAASGLLSFCYWWENGRWYCGESPGPDRFIEAVPGVWTSDTVVDMVSGLLGGDSTAAQRAADGALGWMVYVPVEPGEIAIGRAIFYIADDGVLERSSSSVAPSIYIAEFERRFQDRHGSVDAP
jgi:hypothetical protein